MSNNLFLCSAALSPTSFGTQVLTCCKFLFTNFIKGTGGAQLELPLQTKVVRGRLLVPGAFAKATQISEVLVSLKMEANSPRKVKIGIIGGSGLDNPDILDNRREKHVDTPYGKPSDALILGDVGGVECVLLARHGRGHTVMPTNINFRANVHALKTECCTHLIVSTACGSLREDIHPGDMVILDQFIDRTTKRATTFYDGNPGSPVGVCHLPMDTPFCPHTRKILLDVCKELEIRHHESGTMVTIEGPRFSSRAESKMFRMWGGDVINMTTVPEVALAKEAGMCYAAVAMATDYDCWRDDPGHHVSVEAVLKVFKGNAEKGVRIFKTAIPKIAQRDWSAVLEENRVTVSSSTMLPPSEG